MDTQELAQVQRFAEALQPTRWVLLRRAATKPLFRAEEAREMARNEAGFAGTESTARFHATWLKNEGYLDPIQDGGRLAYRITDPGRRVYNHVKAVTANQAEAIQPRTESRVVAIVASLGSDDYDVFADESGELDLSADLRRGIESVLTARTRIRVEPAS